MANKSDYFGLSYIVSLILAIIPFTSWIWDFDGNVFDKLVLDVKA